MMKQEQKRHSILGQRAYSTTTGLIVLLLIYSLLTVLVLVFARQILSDLSLSRQFSGYLLIPMGIVLPVFLIGALVVNVIRLRRERRAGDPGVKLKVKLIVFFVFISILSALPQALLSFNFIRSALFSWYSGDTSQALDAGLRSALEVYQGGLERLRTLNDSPLYTRMLESYQDRPQQFWNTIQNTGSGIGSLQLFGPSGREREFFGDQAARIEGKAEIRSEGLMPKASRAGRSVIRAVRFLPPPEGGGNTGYAVLGIVLPEGFDQDARMLTEASERFQQIGEFRGLFQIVIFLLYSFFALPILLIAVLSSFLLSNEIMRPIVNLELATRKVAEGDYTYRLLTRRGDELSQLVSSFNRMLSELEHTRMQVKQTEKVAAWQEIAQRLAHEIRNPLTPIKLSAERILRKFHNGTQPVSEFLEPGLSAIIREVEGLNRMLLEFRDFAKLPEPQREDINLFEMIREAAAVYHASTTHHRIEITGPEQEIRLYADPKQLKQVFTNLIKNAMEAMPSGGTITITADLVMKGDSHYARIQVRDTGSGISEEDQESVFHPYFTSKEHGTGLGLAIVERIIFDHRGTIWFESEPGVGTTFFIDLPVEQT